jgi:hypothetical protein
LAGLIEQNHAELKAGVPDVAATVRAEHEQPPGLEPFDLNLSGRLILPLLSRTCDIEAWT